MESTTPANPLEQLEDNYHHFINRSPITLFIDTLFRGAGQVMLQNNPLTGLLFFIGLFWAEYATPHSPPVAWGALIAVVVSTLTAMVLGIDRRSITSGLYGFNAVLTGVALPTFLQWGVVLVFYLILVAIVNTVVMAAFTNVLASWGATALLFPFVLVTWFFLLASFFFLHFTYIGPGLPVIPTGTGIDTILRPDLTTPLGGGLTPLNLIQSFFRGIAQVFLQDNLVTGVIFLFALLVNSPFAALYAAIGSLVGLITALLLGGNGYSIYHGMYGYNSVLSGIAIGTVFFTVTWRSGLYALLCIIFTAIVAGALLVFFTPFGLPTLTAGFVFSTWLFVIPKRFLGYLEPRATHAQTHG